MLGKVPTLGGLKSPPSQPCWLTRPKRLVFPAAGSTAYPVTSPLHRLCRSLKIFNNPTSQVSKETMDRMNIISEKLQSGWTTYLVPPQTSVLCSCKNTGLEACLPVPAQPQKPYFILGNSSTHTKHFLTVLHKHTRVYPFFRIFLSYFVLFFFLYFTRRLRRKICQIFQAHVRPCLFRR